MHRPQFFTWTTHTAENTTLLDYKKLYTYMCNIVTEFYLYSIVYIYLINSRLDVTFSVRHHFRISNFITDNILTGHQALNHLDKLPNFKTFKDGEEMTIVQLFASLQKAHNTVAEVTSHLTFLSRTLQPEQFSFILKHSLRP